MTLNDYKRLGKFVVHCKREKYDVYIGRPSKWGNPYSTDAKDSKYLVDSRSEAINKFEEMVKSDPLLIEQIKLELKGKILGCFCAPEKICHGYVLASIAND